MLKKKLYTAVFLTAAVLTIPAVRAADVAGVHVDDRSRVGNADLVLNGAGVRTKVFFKVYVAALYAPKKTAAVGALLETREPRRMALHMMRDLDADSLVGALKEGLQNNHSAGELTKLKAEIDQFEGIMRGVGNARKGDLVTLDFSGDGTGIGFNGQARGSVAGEAFSRALLRVWLGDKPVDTDLKQSLLGG
jgi:long-chain acyl-CoA synthetase